MSLTSESGSKSPEDRKEVLRMAIGTRIAADYSEYGVASVDVDVSSLVIDEEAGVSGALRYTVYFDSSDDGDNHPYHSRYFSVSGNLEQLTLNGVDDRGVLYAFWSDDPVEKAVIGENLAHYTNVRRIDDGECFTIGRPKFDTEILRLTKGVFEETQFVVGIRPRSVEGMGASSQCVAKPKTLEA